MIAKNWWGMLTTSDETWPTFIRSIGDDGRLIGVGAGKKGEGGATWLYRSVPFVAMSDARDDKDVERGIAVLDDVFGELARQATILPGGRSFSRSTYREFHLLAVAVPTWFTPPPGHELAHDLAAEHPRVLVPRRVTLFGVRLAAQTRLRGNWRDKTSQLVDQAVSVLWEGEDNPQTDFDMDAETVGAIMSRAGMSRPTTDELAIADGWWSNGTSQTSIIYPHNDHGHMFRFAGEAKKAHHLDKTSHDQDGRDCTEWDGRFEQWGFQVAAGVGTSFTGITETSPAARWGAALLRAGAVVVSIRGLVEPSRITGMEAKKARDRMAADIAVLHGSHKEVKGSQQDRLDEQASFFSAYERLETSGLNPTLTSTSVVVILDGTHPRCAADISQSLPVALAPMDDQQHAGLVETLLCSPVRANPRRFDWPAQCVSAAGLNDLSACGDGPSHAVLIGFTERDQQPVWTRSDASTAGKDAPPIDVVVGGTGSGKTQVILYKWKQNGRMMLPTGRLKKSVFVNPKSQLLGHVATAYGGTVFLLDDMLATDGSLDALSVFTNPAEGFEAAMSVVQAIYPGDVAKRQNAELPLRQALRFGIDQGASATGQALRMWVDHAREVATGPMGQEEHTRLSRDIMSVMDVLELVRTDPRAKALIGVTAGSRGFALVDGLTMIEATGGLSLPSLVSKDLSGLEVGDRMSLAIIRAILYTAMHALAGQKAYVFLDEAWVFMSGAAAEMDRLGRLARSLDVPVCLANQRMDQVLELSDYVSQGLIMHLPGPPDKNAIPAFRMFGIDPDYGGRWHRAVADAELQGFVNTGSTNFNPESLKAHVRRDEENRVVAVERGSVAYYVDLHGMCVPVHIKLPKQFLQIASTNPDDVAGRTGGPRMLG